MFEPIFEIFRKRKIRKHQSNVPTGLIPLDKIKTVNVVIDVEEDRFDLLAEDIIRWGRKNGLKVCIYFFDFRKIGKDELLLTSIDTTILKKDLNWLGAPDFSKIFNLVHEPSDLFISMIDNGSFPIEFVSKCAKAGFKIGRCGFKGHAYDMVMVNKPEEDLKADSRVLFSAITEMLTKIR